jgi:hypothetical protein
MITPSLVTALTTLITIQLTGVDGGFTAVVTPVTLPLNQIQATTTINNGRFKRSLSPSFFHESTPEILATRQPFLSPFQEPSSFSSSSTFHDQHRSPDPMKSSSENLSLMPQIASASFSCPIHDAYAVSPAHNHRLSDYEITLSML